ncbi:TetR/AcrR family transcriptional regulator [Nocardia noduli]|nr:TetR/AcrR family transcriptional regulator [Nocardia noduli]
MTTSPSDAVSPDSDLAIRLPKQQRSRESWARILDAGVAVIEEGGYDAFTIAAVCERADVAPRAIYERVNTKEGLFLAVYEHGLSGLLRSQDTLLSVERWQECDTEQLIHGTVAAIAQMFTSHAAFLRSVILIGGVHPEIYRRGSINTRALGEAVTAVLIQARDDIAHPDPEAAIRMSFDMIFSSLVMRTTYGRAFLGPPIDDDTYVRRLSQMIRSYLLYPVDGPARS